MKELLRGLATNICILLVLSIIAGSIYLSIGCILENEATKHQQEISYTILCESCDG